LIFVWILVVFFPVTAMVESVLASDASRVIPASEVLDKIREGMPVYYDNVIIVGNLNVSNLNKVTNSLAISNSTIIAESNFDGITFAKDVNFWGTSFRDASFDNTSFSADAEFSNTSFQNVSFSEAVFDHPAYFYDAKFRESVNFEDSQFQKDAPFSGACFLGDADFNYTRFNYYSYFHGTKFHCNAHFSDVKFGGFLDFSSANITHDANFLRSEFQDASFDDVFVGGLAQFGLTRFYRLTSFESSLFASEADFNLARFDDSVSFSKTSFKDNAFFGGIKLDRFLNFMSANFEKMLVLKASLIHIVLLENATFRREAKVVLDDADIAILRAPWNSIGDHIEYNGAAYLALVKNYKELEWFSDSNDCYYTYRKLGLEHEPLSPMKLLDYLAWIFFGFGVKPEMPVGWSVSFVLVFGAIYWFRRSIRKFIRIETIKMVTFKDGRNEAQIETTLIEKPITLIDPFLFSLANFTSGWTTFLYPFTDFKTTGGHTHLAIMERILGSVFISLILAAIIKTYLTR
jgi:uncharacterized protein YjbI with pentapeptide repeats